MKKLTNTEYEIIKESLYLSQNETDYPTDDEIDTILKKLKDFIKVKSDKPKVTIFSDGSCIRNPDGPGGYGVIVYHLDEDDNVTSKEEFANGFDITTNNRMEMMGVIEGLKSLSEPCDVLIVSDSSYVIKAFQNKWIDKWLNNDWKTSTGTDVKNKDLWELLLSLMERHNTKFKWVKGHNGNLENERCDFLANTFAHDKNKLVKKDDGIYYEK